jgi:hypothetical protein
VYQSLLEINKVLPEQIRQFDYEFTPELKSKEWVTTNHFFNLPQNFNVMVRARQEKMK